MATTLADIQTLISNAAFVGRVTAAVLSVGSGIIKTIVDSGSATAVEKARVRLAENAIADPDTYGAQFARVLAVQPGITDASTDAAIINTVQAAWNYLSRLNL